ncbi:GntR family transcriptional regulator [Thermogemmatispora carboxidivorans]|uniref:GntR family transcriptional regulator n=1 Tax=Thermogemmatispora carboxidivorans TaxID=1382306 RepID=UPI0009E09E72|nr:GntR family transcriptional regulator [Thermogemmatispora carboxidivorans]
MQQVKEGVVIFDTDVIVRDSPVPYYYQLARYIERKIKSREWLPHQLLPSEQEICTRLDVSRTVVRQAMDYLVKEGLVVKQNGKRSSIAGPKYSGDLMQNLRGFYEDAIAKGKVLSTRVLDLKVIGASGDVAEALRLDEGTPVIMLKRLRFLDGEPTVLVTTYLPEHLCPSLIHEDFTRQSLYTLLSERYHLEIAEAVRTIEAVSATQQEARLLGIVPGSPLLLLKSVGFLRNGLPLEYYIARHRGDRSKFQVHLIEPAR